MPEKFLKHSGPKGFWDSVGRLQYRFLRREGLQPTHTLLDVGCGTFRAGRFIVKFLESGNYYGFDEKQSAIEWGRRHVLKKLMRKNPHLFTLRMESKPVDLVEVLKFAGFDYIWMHAFLDHVGPDKVESVFCSVEKVLADDGYIYATSFIANEHTAEWGKEKVETYSHKDPWHYTVKFLKKAASNAGLHIDGHLGYVHPLGLTMLRLARDE